MNAATEHNPILFDDFLGLEGEDFRQTRLIVFAGISGSGKSTALKFLCDHHPAFSGKPQRWIWTMEKTWDTARIRCNRLVVVDEVSHPRQLPAVARLLKQNQTVAVASHLKPAWFWPFRLAGRYRHFLTDHDCAKIARHLTRHGISHTAAAVEEFCRRHGASYVDLDCILERHPGESLDRALHLSLKLDQLTIERSKQWIPVMPVIGDTRKPFECAPTAGRPRWASCGG